MASLSGVVPRSLMSFHAVILHTKGNFSKTWSLINYSPLLVELRSPAQGDKEFDIFRCIHICRC